MKTPRQNQNKHQQSDAYYAMMESNTILVFDFIKELFKVVAREVPTDETSFFSFMIEFQEKRSGTVWLRPTLLWLFYKALGGQGNPESILPAMASIELLNSSTYLFNSVLDAKLGYTTPERIEDAIITGNMYREIAQTAMTQQICDDETKKIILQRISTINLAIYKGQYVDLRALRQDRNAQEISDLFTARYAGFSGAFYSFIPELAGLLAQASHENIEIVRDFGLIYGNMVQLANDMGDCVPPINDLGHKEKPYKDTLSDLRNGRLNLPIWLALRHPDCNHSLIEETHIQGRSVDETYKLAKRIGEHFIELGVFDEVKKELQKQLKIMNGLLDTLPKTEWRDFIKSHTRLFMLKNKWFRGLKKAQ